MIFQPNPPFLLFPDNPESEDFYAELAVPLNTQLVAISSEIDKFILQGSNSSLSSTTSTTTTSSLCGTAVSPKPSQQTSSSTSTLHPEVLCPKFLYLNECNSRHNGTLTGKNGALSRDLINILMDLYEETNDRNVSEETIVKTMNDFWLFRKNCNSRCFFVLINKYATLVEISGEWG